MSISIPITKVDIGPEEEALVIDVLRSGQLAQGAMVERLEGVFCRATGSTNAVAVSSGTTALVAALQVLNLEAGDEVITSPFTFAATLNAIIEAGAAARFADIGDDFNIDPDRLIQAIGPRTRALMPVHLYGFPADMVRIREIAAKHELPIVEDAAQAVGAWAGPQPVGSYGLGCFSLYATKNITAGEGGMITLADADLAERLRILRNQGMRRPYEYVVPGHNYRMTELQAAVAIGQMSRLEEIIACRQRNAAVLSRGLEGVPGLRLPETVPDRKHVFHQYTVRVSPHARLSRDALADALARQGIGTGIYYPRTVFDYECYRNHPLVRTGPVPNATRAAGQVLSLPVHPTLSSSDLDRVIANIRTLLGV